LFGSIEDMAKIDSDAHLKHVVDIFLNGALPRRELSGSVTQATAAPATTASATTARSNP
jgi:hypothetical protein